MSDETPLVQLTLFSEASPVNPQVTQENDGASPMTAGSGVKRSGLSRKSSRATSYLSTYPVLGRSMAGIPFETSSGNLPVSGTMLNGHIYALPTLVPRTDANVSSLWPTPMWADGDKNSPATKMGLPN